MKKGAFIVTFVGLLLPYRLRVYYGFALNFILAPLKIAGQLLVLVNTAVLFVLLFFVYFLIMPVTVLLKPKEGIIPQPLNECVDGKNLFRMF